MGVRLSDEEVTRATRGRRVREGRWNSYDGICTDTRSLSEGCLFLAIRGKRFDGHQFVAEAAARGARGAVVTRGHPWSEPVPPISLFEVEDTLAALGALAQFHRARFTARLGAVTGSNGKTTVKEMTHSILARRGPALKTVGNLNNEVGVPLTLFQLSQEHVAAVIEMGMSAPGEIARLTTIAAPDAGLITSVQPAHLISLGGLDAVAQAKGELFHALRPGATAVVNVDDPRIVAQAESSRRPTLTFGRAQTAAIRLSKVETQGKEGLWAAIEYRGREYGVQLRFFGEHNAQNAVAAFALATALGYSPQECVEGLQAAKPYSHRLNLLRAPAGFAVLDDCYNANPASMEAALMTLESLARGGRAVAVLGDMLELGPSEIDLHRTLGERAARISKLTAFFGPLSAQAYGVASQSGVAAAHFLEIEPLLAWLRPRLGLSDVVLVKGSRGMQLERVVNALVNAEAAGEPH